MEADEPIIVESGSPPPGPNPLSGTITLARLRAEVEKGRADIEQTRAEATRTREAVEALRAKPAAPGFEVRGVVAVDGRGLPAGKVVLLSDTGVGRAGSLNAEGRFVIPD